MHKGWKENKIIKTEDGSHSLVSGRFKVAYHSKNGAWQETQHVFVNAGLQYHFEIHGSNSVLNVLEIGIGTGLNALTSYQWALTHKPIKYTGLEAYPINQQTVVSLNYHDFFESELNFRDKFQHFHMSEWGKWHKLSDEFTYKKILIKFEKFRASSSQFGVIFFDAFAPSSQPELWSVEIFKNMFDMLEPGGILVTYCAKGQVKRNMKDVGFVVETIPGPKGKREMTRAHKNY